MAEAGHWGEEEVHLLREIASRLSPHSGEIVLDWTARLVSFLDIPGQQPEPLLQAVGSLNQLFLEDHFRQLAQGDLESALKKNLDNDLALLRSQREGDPELRTTLYQLYLSLEISTAVITRRIRSVFEDDPRLPSMLDTYGRLALHLGKLVGEAFNQVRVEELGEALRVASALLDTSRELSARSTSRADVLRKLNEIVLRVVGCDRSVVYLWNQAESVYVATDGLGFGAAEMAQIQSYRFAPEEHASALIVHGGEACSGWLNDGVISREVMQRHGLATYALTPMIDSAGHPLGALAAYRKEMNRFNATDLQIFGGIAQNAALALENANLVEELEAAARLKNEFLNSMSHEIRTPLHILYGYLDMLYDRHGADEGDRNILDRMRQNSGYVLTLVNTILDIGRIESGQMPINLSTFAADGLLEDVREMFGALAASRQIAFSCHCEESVPPLTNDRLKVLEILNNLVGNAFKFTESGTVHVQVSTPSDRASVLFEVRDTGVGIAPSAIGAIFDLFRQVGEPAQGGTGLGLYIVRRLTDLLGGHVEVESVQGQGTTFRVSLPTSVGAAAH